MFFENSGRAAAAVETSPKKVEQAKKIGAVTPWPSSDVQNRGKKKTVRFGICVVQRVREPFSPVCHSFRTRNEGDRGPTKKQSSSFVDVSIKENNEAYIKPRPLAVKSCSGKVQRFFTSLIARYV